MLSEIPALLQVLNTSVQRYWPIHWEQWLFYCLSLVDSAVH